ncbi:MAG TPA: SPFH domain-containing protein [Pirellulales bacterium]|jgi:regulator of protease activity HflC (stomatin/prohibitin superfamily)|nr:SPFH domain-containing protein [Pirellulales bacterium]
MFGFKYLKAPPTTYVLDFRNGQVAHEGAGLSFFYFAPTAVIVNIPLASMDVPFLFNEVTADFQDATIQGELTYRVTDPKRLAALLDYSVNAAGRFRSDDPQKLNDRLIHAAQIHARDFTQRVPLKELLVNSGRLVTEVLAQLKTDDTVTMLGVEVLSLSIISIKGTPEMSKALQAAAREELLRRADEAIYARRNAAVELERTIKENEFHTEVMVEQKKRQVRETKMSAEIAVEQQRAQLVDQQVDNERKEADGRVYALRAALDSIKEIDWRTLMAAKGFDPQQLIALAFRDLAEGSEKIGQLNITPDLLQALLRPKE